MKGFEVVAGNGVVERTLESAQKNGENLARRLTGGAGCECDSASSQSSFRPLNPRTRGKTNADHKEIAPMRARPVIREPLQVRVCYFFAAGFFATAFFGAAFLAAGFFAAAFFGAAFLAAGFFTAAFFGAAFLATGFLAAGFLAAGFFTAAFFGAAFLAAGFLAAGFLATAFFGAAFFAVVFACAIKSLQIFFVPMHWLIRW